MNVTIQLQLCYVFVKFTMPPPILILKWFHSPTLGSEINNKVLMIPRGLPRGYSFAVSSLKSLFFAADTNIY